MPLIRRHPLHVLQYNFGVIQLPQLYKQVGMFRLEGHINRHQQFRVECSDGVVKKDPQADS